MKTFWTIKNKLIIFAFCISLIPISTITAIYYFNSRSTVRKQILQELTAVAESKKMHTLSFIEAKKARVIDFSSDGFIRDSLEMIAHRGYQSNAIINLKRHLKENKKPLDPHIAAIAVVDLNGKVVSSTNEKLIGKDLSKQEIFINIINKNYGETYIGQHFYSPYLNVNCIFISAPLTGRYGVETMGIIINAYDLAALEEITTNLPRLGKKGEGLFGGRVGEGIVFFFPL